MSSVAHIIRRRRHRRKMRAKARASRQTWVMFFAVVIAVILLGPLGLLVTTVVSAYGRAVDTLPEPRSTIFRDPVIGATEIYDAQGQTLLFSVRDPLGDQRTWIDVEDLPQTLVDATVLAEDPDFLTTHTFDPFRVMSNLWNNSLEGPLPADPSLTGRLVRNVLLPPQDVTTSEDRALEIALIAEINRRYDPEAIVEWHLNTNYYGNEAYGIEAAAQVYLGKSARNLTLDEVVLLAAIPTAPRFNPVDNEVAARDRQSDLLERLLAADAITQVQFQSAVNTVTFIRPDAGQAPLVAPEFAIYARQQAETILNALGENGAELVSRGGLRITTTLDLDLYYQAECALRVHIDRLGGQTTDPRTLEGGDCISVAYLPLVESIGERPPSLGSVVIIDPQTGEVKAMAGSGARADYQPGPTLYPFIYLSGMLNASPNYTPASMVLDVPQDFPGAADGLLYLPQNADGEFRGPMSLRDAMGAGLRVPAIQLANVLNLNRVMRNFAYPLGVTGLSEGIFDLSLLERGGSVSLLEMVYAYSTFAALGDVYDIRRVLPESALNNRVPVAIKRIEAADGEVLWDYDSLQIAASRVEGFLQTEAAYVINDILADDATRWPVIGTNSVLEMSRPAAVVYGLTSDQADNWTIGYTPYRVVGVHVGRDDGGMTSMQGYGLSGAAPVWRAVMDYVHERDGIPAQRWQRPDEIAEAQVCVVSGGLANGACNTRTEIFLDAATLPGVDTNWQTVEINSENGLRATINTPNALRVNELYFVPPPGEAMEWWQARNLPLPPTDFDSSNVPGVVSAVRVLTPENFAIVGGDSVEIRGELNPTQMDYYQVSYGEGSNPATWINLTDQIRTYTPGTVMAMWDTVSLEGTYTLRLQVRLLDGSTDRGFAQVIVDNIAPSIILSAGEQGQVFRWPEDQSIPLIAQVADNIRIDRVEFYNNDALIGARREPPFAYEHILVRPGSEEFTAIAFDEVGNATETTINVEVLRSGG